MSEKNTAALTIAEVGRTLIARPLERDEASRAAEELTKASGVDLLDAVDMLIAEGMDHEKLKPAVSKLINLMSRKLDAVVFKPEDPFFRSLVLENEAFLRRLDELRPIVAGFGPGSEGQSAPLFKKMAALVEDLKSVSLHYAKKENILFPRFEALYPRYRCVSLMWSLHSDVREELDGLAALLSTPSDASDEHALAMIRSLSGRLFFDAHALVFREEKILFPLVAELLDGPAKEELFLESAGLGFCFLASERVAELEGELAGISRRRQGAGVEGSLDLDCGCLPAEVLDLVLKSLPVDVTFVDAADKVAYFSNGAGRVFPRSPSIIGRDVRNCHPAKSLDKVLAIIEAFKRGEREREEFWLQTGGRFVRIEYKALRGASGEYLGTLEISQDLSEARALEGEKRLLSF